MKINDKVYKRKVKKLEKYIARTLPNETLKEFKSNTPIDTGNARRHTKIKSKRRTGFKVVGEYPYSGVIDEGLYPSPPKSGTGKTRGGYSTQSLKGIVKPTLKWLQKKIDKFIRRI